MMKWGFLVVILIGTGLLFGAPFLEFLMPDEKIWLVDLTDQQNPTLLANGAKTLWFQWQGWAYIALFGAAIAALLGIILNVIQKLTDRELSEKKEALRAQTAEFKRSQREFEKNMTEQIRKGFAHERNTLEIMTREALEADEQARETQADAERINKITNNNNRAQSRENRSKLAQRDRLGEQKRVISQFLDQAGWTFVDGSPITYAAIHKLAKNHDEQKHP